MSTADELSAPDPTPGDLRAAIARRRPPLPLYQLAARVRVHPVTLSAVLNERRPLTPELANRILRAVSE